MSTFGTVDPAKIALRKVKIVRATIDDSNSAVTVDIKGFRTDIVLNTALNLEDKLVKTELELKIEADSETSFTAICSYNIHFTFHVDNIDELTRLENDALTLSKSLHGTLASISYSTARGMLLDRLQNTVFQDFILPVVSSNNLVKS